MTNAFLITGDEKYRAWVVEYTDAWVERAQANGGMLPDNVGLSGQVGEYCAGNWYGGRYGWTFPHGFLTLQKATLDAAANAYLLTRDRAYLDLPRQQMDRILEQGRMEDIRDQYMSVAERWASQFAAMGEKSETLLVPYRYGDAGWFDWQPMSPVYPVTLWNLSMDEGRLGAHGGHSAKRGVRLGRGVPLSQQRGFGARGPLGALFGRGQSDLSRAYIAGYVPSGRPPLGPTARRSRRGHPSPRPPLAMGQSGLFRSTHSAHDGRPATHLQRRPAARSPALL